MRHFIFQLDLHVPTSGVDTTSSSSRRGCSYTTALFACWDKWRRPCSPLLTTPIPSESQHSQLLLTAAHAATNSATTGSAYYCSKLNDSTHLVVHRDSYYEYPFIYVKVCTRESLAVVIETGCGTHHHGMPKVPDQEVRDFVLANILTSDQNSYDLLVLCTHCHLDHMGGIEAFSKGGARIVASGYDRDFLSPGNREENSLCGAFRMKTPEYTITHFTVGGEVLKHRGRSLGLRILHTPGHTPDSMAIYDEAE